MTPWTAQARILEWVAFPFSRASSQPRDRTQVCPTLQTDSLPGEPPGTHEGQIVGLIIMRLLSLSHMHSGLLDVFSWCDSSFFFFSLTAELHSIVWRHHSFLKHSPAERRPGCVSVLAFESEAPPCLCAGLGVDLSFQLCVCLAASNSLWPVAVACWHPLPVEFSRQEYWSGLAFPTPGGSF